MPRRAAYRDLLRGALDDAPLTDLRLALKQDQPIGNDRFYREIEAEIEATTGQRRGLRKRDPHTSAGDAEPGEL